MSGFAVIRTDLDPRDRSRAAPGATAQDMPTAGSIGSQPLPMAGVLDATATFTAIPFMDLCAAFIPLVFLADCPGFIGKEWEQRSMLKWMARYAGTRARAVECPRWG